MDRPSFDDELGPRIDVVCRRIGSRGDAAQAAGVTTAQLQRIMNRSSAPGMAVINNLAKESGASVDWIANGVAQNKTDVILECDMIDRIVRAIETRKFGKTDVAYKVFLEISGLDERFIWGAERRKNELRAMFQGVSLEAAQRVEEAGSVPVAGPVSIDRELLREALESAEKLLIRANELAAARGEPTVEINLAAIAQVGGGLYEESYNLWFAKQSGKSQDLSTDAGAGRAAKVGNK